MNNMRIIKIRNEDPRRDIAPFILINQSIERPLVYKLSILIPTIVERAEQFDKLVSYIENLIDIGGFENEIEILSFSDNKEATIGEKREELYKFARGIYSWQIDDDDEIAPDAMQLIMDAIYWDHDCITFRERCLINGEQYKSNFSLKYADWGDQQDGYDFVRTPFFKTPIKTEICRCIPIPHIRFGEDHAFAKLIRPHLESEYHIDKELYYYIHNSTPHNERYGIKETGD